MRHSVLLSPAQQYRISIHAPLTGCDFIIADDKTSKRYFNPRTPYGMRLPVFSVAFVVPTISIHAPLTGCDLILKKILIQHHYFNPRTPYGMRPLLQSHSPSFAKFQSTHPLRDATMYIKVKYVDGYDFNPRTPYGMRPQKKQNHYLNFTLFDKFILSYSQNYDN